MHLIILSNKELTRVMAGEIMKTSITGMEIAIIV